MEAWEKQLISLDTHPLSNVKLICDGIKVTYQNQIEKRRVFIMTYVEGCWSGEYFKPENPTGLKFGKPKFVGLPRKYIEAIRRLNGKKAADAEKKNKKKYINSPDWPSARPLIKHLKSTCKSISLYEEEDRQS